MTDGTAVGQDPNQSGARVHSPRPFHQVVALVVVWTLGGVVALGALLGALSDANAFFSYERALVGSAVTLTCWAAVELWARHRGISWVSAGQTLVVRRLGPRYRFGALGVLGLLWVPSLTGRAPAPSPPAEIGSTYHSDLPRLLFDPPGPAPGLPFRSVLALRNITQSTLVRVSVSVLKTTLAGPQIDSIHPYLPPQNVERFYAGSSPEVLPPSGDERSYLLPGESMTIDLARYVDSTERAMLASKAGSNIEPLRARSLATLDLGVPSSDKARRFAVSFPGRGAGKDEYFGVLFWFVVSYQTQERTHRLIFFGGLLRGRAPASGAADAGPVVGIVDFVAQLPYAYVSARETSEQREVYTSITTDLSRDDPKTIPGFSLNGTLDARQWVAPFWSMDPPKKNEKEQTAPAHHCEPSIADKDGLPDWKFPVRKGSTAIRGGSFQFATEGVDFSAGGTQPGLTYKALFDGASASVSTIVKVVDAGGKVAALSMELSACTDPKYFTLTKELLASRGVDPTKVVRVEIALAPSESAEGHLYIWGFQAPR